LTYRSQQIDDRNMDYEKAAQQEQQPPPPPYSSYQNSYGAPMGSPYVVPCAVPYTIPYAVPFTPNSYIVQARSDAFNVNDYLAWSIVNLFVGWLIGGIIALIFSILCRNHKSVNNYNSARSMSTVALILNILVTVSGVIGWIIFFTMIAIYATIWNAFH
jgi:hypothetical protein